jgi:hypothetical protein
MSYINDPREMAIRSEDGMTLEQDNRHEQMYQWGAMIIDLCDLPVEEYMKPMTVIGLGGGNLPETGDTMYILKFVVDDVVVLQESLKSGDPIPFTVNAEKEGRNFLGWYYGGTKYEDGSLMPSRNLTLTAKYSCDISFVFVIDGVEEEVSSYTINYNTKPSNIPSVNKPGYKFLGWEPSTAKTVTEHTVFKGSFESIVYVVTWSGYTDGVLTQEYKYGDTLIVPTYPEKEGYTFVGWDKNVPDIVTSNLSFNAKFTINKYNITYHEVIDGVESEPISSITLTYNSTIPSKNKLVKSGYTYTDWEGYNSETGEEFNGTRMPSFNLKYISIRTTNEYVLGYYDNNELIKEDSYLYNSQIIPFIYEKEGWTVSEWENLPEFMPYHNVSAHCTSIINVYEILFIDQDGNEYIVEAEYGTPIADIIPVIDGKTFELPEEYEGKTVSVINEPIKGNVKINEYKATITIDGNTEEIELLFGTNVEEYFTEKYPAEEGYHIVIESNYETVPSNDELIVTIKFEPNIWILSYHTTGAFDDMNGSKEVAFGTPILNELPEISKLEGYDFSGWYNGEIKITESDLMPNNNLYVSGEYIIKSFSVIIKDGEIIVFEKSYEYGTPLSEIVNDEIVVSYIKELELIGYNGVLTLNGELVDENSLIASDIEINIERSEKEYLLTFMNGENIISSTSVKFNSIIEYPVMNNYTEDGVEYIFYWDDESYNGKPMPPMDLIINGQYQAKSEAPIYYGSFKVSKSAYTPDNTTQYLDESKLETEHYGIAIVSECFGDGLYIRVPIIGDPEMAGMNAIQKRNYLKLWTQPLAIMVPCKVANENTIQLFNAAGIDTWHLFKTDKQIVSYRGNDYYFFVQYDDEVLNPVATSETLNFTLKLIIK